VGIPWRSAQGFVMAARFIRELYQSLKVRIDLPKFAQNERIAGRQYKRQQHRYANGYNRSVICPSELTN
jgi:hypothetical protein